MSLVYLDPVTHLALVPDLKLGFYRSGHPVEPAERRVPVEFCDFKF